MENHIIIRILIRIFDLIVLNILWLVCSVPIVTIGASTTALYSVMLKVVAGEEGYIMKGFFKAFQVSFRQSWQCSTSSHFFTQLKRYSYFR